MSVAPYGPRDALVVVDMQNDFIDGSVAIPDAASIVPVINRLCPLFSHVVFTQDWHPHGHVSFASSHEGAKPGDVLHVSHGEQPLYADHCVRNERGADLHPDLDLSFADLVLRKGRRLWMDSFSAFVENDNTTPTGLASYLRERRVERVFVVGLALYGCVRHSAIDARRAGFDAAIFDDASRGRPAANIAAMSAELAAAGVRRLRTGPG